MCTESILVGIDSLTHTHLINAVNLTKFDLKCELIERRKLNFT